ncbi:MAG: YggT family protein [Gammaproteobacteria bacterium]|nr:YggT family protein [Gammaproteobacteria bacterium]
MSSALIFVLRTLFDLYLLTFALRLLLQWSRLPGRNQLLDFIVRVTNPLVVPLRRVLPAMGRVDTGTAAALAGLQIAGTAVTLSLGCVAGTATVWQILGLALLDLISLVLRIYSWSILIHVVLSWVGQAGYNPAAALVNALVEPVLAPLRRVIPPIAGFDLSPLFAWIAIEAIRRALPIEQLLAGMLCLPGMRSLF